MMIIVKGKVVNKKIDDPGPFLSVPLPRSLKYSKGWKGKTFGFTVESVTICGIFYHHLHVKLTFQGSSLDSEQLRTTVVPEDILCV